MAAHRTDNVTRIIVLMVLVFIGLIAWRIAPMFLPVHRWLHVDLHDEAVAAGLPAQALLEAQRLRLRYAPRGAGDPLPWQMMIDREGLTPDWEKSPDGAAVDEWQTLVRCDLVSDRTGAAPGLAFKGAAYYDNYYDVSAWRLPAGSLGRRHTRPVVLYDAGTFEKMPIGSAKAQDAVIRHGLKKGEWLADDELDGDFPWRTDSYQAPDESESFAE
ncbi:MAG: hypothetical protein ACYTF0_00375 [Planctomycetota bacterium]|jgi:hypothetical protein